MFLTSLERNLSSRRKKYKENSKKIYKKQKKYLIIYRCNPIIEIEVYAEVILWEK